MVTRDDILDVLKTIDDPEMPITIVDLGIVEDIRLTDAANARVEIDILPTFIGCPALPILERDILAKVGRLDDVENVTVRFVFDPPWSVDRINERGRKSLKEHGVTVPRPTSAAPIVQVNLPVTCPFCDSTETHVSSPFGPTRCRMIYYCDACKNTFEHMKRV